VQHLRHEVADTQRGLRNTALVEHVLAILKSLAIARSHVGREVLNLVEGDNYGHGEMLAPIRLPAHIIRSNAAGLTRPALPSEALVKRYLLVALSLASIAVVSAQGQKPAAPDPLAIGGKDTAWFMDRVSRPDTDSEPQAPFKIMGNVYYIGANNIASILVATPQGHILLDTGTQKMAAVVFPNMVKLGFKPADIKVMLISHAHYDHMETMETIRRLTGATVAALEAEVPALVSGHDLGSNETWGQEPLQIGRVLKSGEDIVLGGSTVKVFWTPGHTLGAAAYFITAQEDGKTYQIVFGGPPGPITGDPKYDTRPEDAYASYKALRAMNPDILVSGHPQNLFKGKLDALWANKRPSPLTLAPGQWTKMIDDSEAAFKKRLAAASTPTR
jgi:metallo-beta-lactamase class B